MLIVISHRVATVSLACALLTSGFARADSFSDHVRAQQDFENQSSRLRYENSRMLYDLHYNGNVATGWITGPYSPSPNFAAGENVQVIDPATDDGRGPYLPIAGTPFPSNLVSPPYQPPATHQGSQNSNSSFSAPTLPQTLIDAHIQKLTPRQKEKYLRPGFKAALTHVKGKEMVAKVLFLTMIPNRNGTFDFLIEQQCLEHWCGRHPSRYAMLAGVNLGGSGYQGYQYEAWGMIGDLEQSRLRLSWNGSDNWSLELDYNGMTTVVYRGSPQPVPHFMSQLK